MNIEHIDFKPFILTAVQNVTGFAIATIIHNRVGIVQMASWIYALWRHGEVSFVITMPGEASAMTVPSWRHKWVSICEQYSERIAGSAEE